MSRVTRELPAPPRVVSANLAEAVLRASDDAERQSTVALRTASMERDELARLALSQAALSAWLIRALAQCRADREGRPLRPYVADVLADLRRVTGGDPS